MSTSFTNTASELILNTNKVKKNLLPMEGLTWTDLTVICTIQQLQQTSETVTTVMVICELKMNKCWIYKSVHKLGLKKFILVSPSPRKAAVVSLSNWGKILLLMAGEVLNQKS
jgi:hypothetical protein